MYAGFSRLRACALQEFPGLSTGEARTPAHSSTTPAQCTLTLNVCRIDFT
jgi:hypothetical protein